MKWKPERNEKKGFARNPSAMGSLLLGLAVLLIFLTGCASVVPRELRKEIDRSISFQELKVNPKAYLGRTVLLGGEIIETKNLKDRTELEILQKPLERGDVPIDTDESEGRFLTYHSGYLDPAIYGSGRHVTVVGEVMGDKSLKIGEAEVSYPVISAKFLHLWAKARRYNRPYYYPYYYPYYPYYPYDSFYFGWRLYYHYPLWPSWYYGYPQRHPHKKE